jgi:Rieske Fe-S protein
MTSIGRRRFIAIVGGSLAGTVASACASAAVVRLAPMDGRLRLAVDEYPQLGQSGGFLRIQPQGSAAVLYVLALPNREFAAVSPICTHLGCTVNVEGDLLVCPCHGSTYDRAGAVLRGPAERPLRRFPVALTADQQLIIDWSEWR